MNCNVFQPYNHCVLLLLGKALKYRRTMTFVWTGETKVLLFNILCNWRDTTQLVLPELGILEFFSYRMRVKLSLQVKIKVKLALKFYHE